MTTAVSSLDPFLQLLLRFLRREIVESVYVAPLDPGIGSSDHFPRWMHTVEADRLR